MIAHLFVKKRFFVAPLLKSSVRELSRWVRLWQLILAEHLIFTRGASIFKSGCNNLARTITDRFQRPVFLYLFLSLSCLHLAGCASMGKTSLQVLEAGDFTRPSPMKQIELVSLQLLGGAAEQKPIGVVRYESFGFTKEDFDNLRLSFAGTIKSVSRQTQSRGKIGLHVLIRRYMIAYTNHSLAMMAAINWCAIEEGNAVLFREDFFVPRSWNVIGPTPGSEKDAIARAVIKRIVDKSLSLAGHSRAKRRPRNPIEGTFSDYKKAVAQLPNEARSWGIVTLSPPMYIPGSNSQRLMWDPVPIPQSSPCLGQSS